MAQTNTGHAIGRAEVASAARELEKMKRGLADWLKYRTLNDQVVAGRARAKLSPEAAMRVVAGARDWQVEQRLADHLYSLLSEVMPDARLPQPNVSRDPEVAVKLAMIALGGAGGAAGPQGLSGPVWMWPAIIVGGVLLAVTSAISSYADVAKEQERYACIQSGACTDYGFYLKWAAILVGGWFVWEKVGVGDMVKRKVKALR